MAGAGLSSLPPVHQRFTEAARVGLPSSSSDDASARAICTPPHHVSLWSIQAQLRKWFILAEPAFMAQLPRLTSCEQGDAKSDLLP